LKAVLDNDSVISPSFAGGGVFEPQATAAGKIRPNMVKTKANCQTAVCPLFLLPNIIDYCSLMPIILLCQNRIKRLTWIILKPVPLTKR